MQVHHHMHVDQLPDVHKQVVNLSNEWSIATHLIMMTSCDLPRTLQ